MGIEQTFSPTLSLHAPIGEEARELLNRMMTLALSRGLMLSPPSFNVFQAFLALPTPRQVRILEILRKTCEVMEGDRESNTLDRDLSVADEVRLIKKTLHKFGLRAVDDSVFTQIADGDIMEIYNEEAIQIYRSWSFFRFCSYSLMDLLVYDWNTLYERPVAVVNHLMKMLPGLFQDSSTTTTYNLPPYVLTERFLEHDQAFQVQMKWATPLISEETGGVRAFLTTASVTPVSLGSGASLGFI